MAKNSKTNPRQPVKPAEPEWIKNNNPGREPDQEGTYDISHVDRQEGTMDHGELGGNFGTPDSSPEKQNEK